MLRDSRAIIERWRRDGFVLVGVRGSPRRQDRRRDASSSGRADRDGAVDLQAGALGKGLMTASAYFIGLVYKETGSGYGISFPDVPGVVAVADTLDQAIADGAAALGFAFEDWPGKLPQPRNLEELRGDPDFAEASADAVAVAVRPNAPVYAAA